MNIVQRNTYIMTSYRECTLKEALDATAQDPIQRGMLMLSMQKPQFRMMHIKYALDYSNSDMLSACLLMEKRHYNSYTIRGLYTLGASPLLTITKEYTTKKSEVIYPTKEVPPFAVSKIFQSACRNE